MKAQRIFIALDATTLAPTLASAPPRPLASMGPPGIKLTPVPDINLHLTLVFIPEASAFLAGELARGLVAATDLPHPGPLLFRRIDALPSRTRATALVIEPEAVPPGLEALASRCSALVSALGLVHEWRPFRPHVTFARLHPPGDLGAVVGHELTSPILLNKAVLRLYRSTSGAPYQVLAERSLATD